MKRKNPIISIGFLALALLYTAWPRAPMQSQSISTRSSPSVETKKIGTVEDTATNSFYERNKAFIESLPKPSVQVVRHFTQEPRRELVSMPNVGEVIRITFEDGSVGYEPNIPTYDVSSGKFGPMPFPKAQH